MNGFRRTVRVASLLGMALAGNACSGGGGGGGQPSAGFPTATPVASASSAATATPAPGATATARATAVPAASPTPVSVATATPIASSPATPTAAPTAASASITDWPLFGHDAARSGTNPETTSNHGAITFNVLWTAKLADTADNSPILAGSMLYATVRNGTTYGISAASGAIVWTYSTTGPNITTSVPAYDESSNQLYAGGVDGAIHRLNPATGVEDKTNGFPATITLATQTEKDASPLNIANGYVYAQTSGFNGDATPYVGHVVAIAESNGAVSAFNTLCASQKGVVAPTTCPDNRSGMWSRAGVVVDPASSMNGRIYGSTGNGTYAPSSGDYGDSLIALSSNAGTLISNFTPSNYTQLDQDDLDLGSTSAALIPAQSGSNTPLMAVQGGKDGALHLLDRSNLSGSGAILQTISLGTGLFTAPAVYQSPSGQTFVYVALPKALNAYTVTTTNGTTQLVSAWTASASLGGEGTSPAVRDGVVYLAATNELMALDATTGTVLGTTSSLGSVHWESPIVAHGVVYCSDGSDNLTAFSIVQATGSSKARRNAR